MFIITIIVGIFIVLWLIGLLLRKATEVMCNHHDKRCAKKQERKLEKYIRKQIIQHDNTISPYRKKYSDSSFLKEISEIIISKTSGMQISRIIIKSYKISVYSLKVDLNGYVSEPYSENNDEIIFEDQGYQSIPDDNHLEGFSYALNDRLGNIFDISVTHIDAPMQHIPIDYITLQCKFGIIKYRDPNEGLKPTI